jgi:cell division protein FtsW (lipid II flippase)
MIGILGAMVAATQFSYIQKRLSYFVDPESDTSGKGV